MAEAFAVIVFSPKLQPCATLPRTITSTRRVRIPELTSARHQWTAAEASLVLTGRMNAISSLRKAVHFVAVEVCVD